MSPSKKTDALHAAHTTDDRDDPVARVENGNYRYFDRVVTLAAAIDIGQLSNCTVQTISSAQVLLLKNTLEKTGIGIIGINYGTDALHIGAQPRPSVEGDQ